MFEIKISRKAAKFFKSLDDKQRNKIAQLIDVLQEAPIPFQLYNVAKIKGRENTFRIRIDPWRVIYRVYTKDNIIRILKLGNRENVY